MEINRGTFHLNLCNRISGISMSNLDRDKICMYVIVTFFIICQHELI